MSDASHDDHLSVAERSRDFGRAVRIVVMAALVLAVVFLALDNADEVQVGYVVGDVDVPLWIVVLGAALAGLIIGWLVRHRSRRD